MDLSRQFIQVLVVISTDAGKCYNRFNHITMSLLLRAIVGSTGAIDAMLIPIQTMKFYQHTDRGDSNTTWGEGKNPIHFRAFTRETVQLQHAGL
jgi:hypothetical protein